MDTRREPTITGGHPSDPLPLGTDPRAAHPARYAEPGKPISSLRLILCIAAGIWLAALPGVLFWGLLVGALVMR